jgi:hypothetical protein
VDRNHIARPRTHRQADLEESLGPHHSSERNDAPSICTGLGRLLAPSDDCLYFFSSVARRNTLFPLTEVIDFSPSSGVKPFSKSKFG